MPRRQTSGLALAAILGVGTLLLSLMPAITGGMWGRFGEEALNSALTQPIWRMRLGLNIALFGLALTAVHLAFGLLCWLLASASQVAWPRLQGMRNHWLILWFIGGCLWLLTTNAALFPNSALGFPYHALATQRLFGITVHTYISTAMAIGVAGTLILAIRRSKTYQYITLATAAAATAGLITAALPNGRATSTAADFDRPHVVLIGIDSLRADGVHPDITPNIHHFVTNATHLQDVITPLARTFPSWISILTGRLPHTTGAWMNLLPRDQIHTGQTLATTLREHGYLSVYAIDETRFANIDETYGFDQIITPPMGASDFVIGSFGDLPLSNLLVNTRLGSWLFPWLHANRAAHLIYDPDSTVQRLDRELRTDAPLFLALHLTLPHWPYTWADSSLTPLDGPTNSGHYLNTIRRVDRQFADILSVLDQRGILKNALVVLLSDHGQALGREEDFLHAAISQTGRRLAHLNEGHGTSVLSPPQYRVVLAFRAFGKANRLLPEPSAVNAPASLIDIAPTILELLQLPAPEPFDGLSLAPVLRSEGALSDSFLNRIRFTETEYSPRGLSTENLTGSAVAQAARAYEVDPATDRVTVRRERLGQILQHREYAAFIGNRAMAAAIPDMRNDGRRQLLFLSHPFHPEFDLGDVSSADRQLLRESLQHAYGLDLADP